MAMTVLSIVFIFLFVLAAGIFPAILVRQLRTNRQDAESRVKDALGNYLRGIPFD